MATAAVASQHDLVGMNMDVDDPELAQAIAFGAMTDDEMIAHAMRLSQEEASGAASHPAVDQQGHEPSPRRTLDSDASGSSVGESCPSLPEQSGQAPSEHAFEVGDTSFSIEHSSAGFGRGPGESFDGYMSGVHMGGHRAEADADWELAMAMEASYRDQGEGGQYLSEEEMLEKAIRVSQQEQDAAQRRSLLEQQELELRESELMDQMREQRLQEEREHQVELARLHAVQVEEDRIRAEQEAVHRAAALEAKRASLPSEPQHGAHGRVLLQIRLPDGKRLRRAFANTDAVGKLYDFTDVEGTKGVPPRYRLASSFPRQEFMDREITLATAGLSGQVMLNVEIME